MPASKAGSGNYEVQEGDCMASIAAAHGFFWQTLWNLPENADLKAARKDPYVLLPGDQVYIPPKRIEWQPRPTDQRHQFVLKGVPEKVRLVFTDEFDQPLADLPYTLVIDRIHRFTGQTDANGAIEQPIAPDAQKGHIVIGKPGETREYPLGLGCLDPIDSITGLQARLQNLGFYDGPIDGRFTPQTQTAVMLFQDTYKLEATGKYDEATQAKLEDVYGCGT